MPVKVAYLVVITRADLADTALSHHCMANPESATLPCRVAVNVQQQRRDDRAGLAPGGDLAEQVLRGKTRRRLHVGHMTS
jgi:hypothetical protein